MHRQFVLERQFLQGIQRPTFLVRRGAYRNHVLASLQQFLQHRPAKGLLAMNDNSHDDCSSGVL